MNQVDVRRLPPYYAHRKVAEALESRMSDLMKEKERKFRTSLQDHTLFAIICDHKRFKGKEKKKRQPTDEPEETKVEQEAETFDWTKV